MKILITENTLVNFGDDRGGQHCVAADIIDVTKPVAAQVVSARRGLYVDKKDDPSKGGLNTASQRELDAAEKTREARKKTVQTRAQN